MKIKKENIDRELEVMEKMIKAVESEETPISPDEVRALIAEAVEQMDAEDLAELATDLLGDEYSVNDNGTLVVA